MVDDVTYQMWPPQFVCSLRIVQLDVQVLVHTLQRPPYADFILEFDSNFGVYERFEKAEGTSSSAKGYVGRLTHSLLVR